MGTKSKATNTLGVSPEDVPGLGTSRGERLLRTSPERATRGVPCGRPCEMSSGRVRWGCRLGASLGPSSGTSLAPLGGLPREVPLGRFLGKSPGDASGD